MKIAFSILIGLLAVTYPLAIYFGLNYFEPKILAIFLLTLFLVRLISLKFSRLANQKTRPALGINQSGTVAVFGIAIMVFTLLSNDLIGLKFYPVLINFSLLVTCTYSLYFPPTVIERIARIREPDLNHSGVAYTRQITKIWCVFFIANGLMALYTALFTSLEIWTLYNGLLSYLLMGLLFSAEFLYRKLILKKET